MFYYPYICSIILIIIADPHQNIKDERVSKTTHGTQETCLRNIFDVLFVPEIGQAIAKAFLYIVTKQRFKVFFVNVLSLHHKHAVRDNV